VEAALKQAQEKGDLTAFNELLEVLSKPYNYKEMNPLFQNGVEDNDYKTYCGT
jgi:uncharacterized protein YdiU (UPF0061 family)